MDFKGKTIKEVWKRRERERSSVPGTACMLSENVKQKKKLMWVTRSPNTGA